MKNRLIGKKRLTSFAAFGLVALALSGCEPVQPLDQYSPVVDPYRINQKAFQKDLTECRSIAISLQADYQKRQSDQMAANMMAGLLAGALTGAVVGTNSRYQGDLIAYGAAAGLSAGMQQNDYSYDLVKFGPQRVIDRCMSDRGYKILNDLGRG